MNDFACDDSWTVEIRSGGIIGRQVVYCDGSVEVKIPCVVCAPKHIVVFLPRPEEWARDYPRHVLRSDLIVERMVQGLLHDEPSGSSAEFVCEGQCIKIVLGAKT